MCEIATLLTVMGGAGGATAAGATAGAVASAGAGISALQTIGTVLAIGGSLYSGIAGAQSAKAQAATIAQQKEDEKALTAVKEQRSRAQFNTQMRKQYAELAGRGVSLDSPTVMLLGEEAAREMSFEAQAIRSGGIATQQELTHQQRIAKANGTKSLIGGVTGAATSVLKYGPEVWPELLA